MKKMIDYMISAFLILGFLFSLNTAVFAEAENIPEPSEILPSEFLSKPSMDMEDVIKKVVTEERANELYDPEKYSYDTSTYLVEYSVSEDYWRRVKSLDYSGLTEAIDADYPVVYIPVFGDIEDTNGRVYNRVVGYFRLQYSRSLNEKAFSYKMTSAQYNLTSTDFKDKRVVGIYEDISFYLTRTDTKAEQVFLIKYPSSVTDEQETVAVIKTQTDTVILDTSNSLHIGNDIIPSDELPAYSVSEYSERRKEVEKTLYKESKLSFILGSSIRKLLNGEITAEYFVCSVVPILATVVFGAATLIWFEVADYWGYILAAVVMLTVIIAALILLKVRKLRKNVRDRVIFENLWRH